MLQAIIPLLASGINAWKETRRQKAELSRMKHQGVLRIQEAQVNSAVRRAESGDQSAISMDQLSFKNRGWKDDYLLILTTLPLLILFFAPFAELVLLSTRYQAGDLTAAVMAGFTALQQTPDWYLVALLLVYVDTFGFRRLLREALSGKLAQWMGKGVPGK